MISKLSGYIVKGHGTLMTMQQVLKAENNVQIPVVYQDEDEIPETPKVAHTKMGDLFLLGTHRLLCGDSTDSSQVARLMNGEKADMVFTDPPYGDVDVLKE